MAKAFRDMSRRKPTNGIAFVAALRLACVFLALGVYMLSLIEPRALCLHYCFFSVISPPLFLSGRSVLLARSKRTLCIICNEKSACGIDSVSRVIVFTAFNWNTANDAW